MGRRLVENVVLRNPDTGTPASFLSGDELPAWAAKRVTNPALFGEEQDDEPDYPEGDPADSWKVPQLKAYADEHGIDLGDATRKADILAAIAPPADQDGDDGDAEGDQNGQEDGS